MRSANLHHKLSCFGFVFSFKRKLSYCFMHFNSQIVQKKFSSDVFVHKKVSEHTFPGRLFLSKKAWEGLSKMRIFSALQLFSMQGPHVIRKTTFVSTHQYAKFCLFSERDKTACWLLCEQNLLLEQISSKNSSSYFERFLSFFKTFTWVWKPRTFEEENYDPGSGCLKT